MKARTKQKRKHDDKVSKTVDTVLRKIFGDTSTHLIYKYLENRYSLKRDEIAEKIDVFAEGLEEFLMSGAQIIEMRILENVYSSYGLTRSPEFERGRNKPDFVSQMKMVMQKS